MGQTVRRENEEERKKRDISSTGVWREPVRLIVTKDMSGNEDAPLRKHITTNKQTKKTKTTKTKVAFV